MYNEQACQPHERLTFMEESVRKSIMCSEGIANANNKLDDILIRLRGNTPSKLNTEEKRTEPNGNLDRLSQQLDIQSAMLNFLHSQIDELAKYF